ncbi:MAG: VWA domain-containing protein, partial [Gammaproteobacteria bacterium]
MQRLAGQCSALLLFAGSALSALAISTLAAAPPVASDSGTAPRDIVLVLDNSGSMKPLDPRFLSKEAVERFVEGMPDDARVSLVIFDEELLASPLAFVPDRDARRVRRVNLAQLNYRGPWTNTPAALERAIQELKRNGRPGAAKSIVLLNDDVVDMGRKARDLKLTRWLRETLTRDAAETGIKIFTIALSGRSDVELLQEIAQRTGGRYFLAQRAADVASVFSQIADTFFAEDVVQLPVEPKAEQPVEAKPEPPQAVSLEPAPSNLPQTFSPPGAAEKAPLPPTTDTTPSEPIESGSAIATEAAQTAATLATESPQTERSTAAAPPSAVALEPPLPAITPAERGVGSDPVVYAFGIAVLVLAAGTLVLIAGLLRTRKPKPALSSPPEAQLLQAFLYDLSGVTGCERHELGAITVIGRVPPSESVNHIVINRPSIGRRHVVIEREHHGFWLVDQNSKNGTSLNGYPVSHPVCLTHGDRVQFHDFVFEFSLAGMALADATVVVRDLTLIKPGTLAETEQMV